MKVIKCLFVLSTIFVLSIFSMVSFDFIKNLIPVVWIMDNVDGLNFLAFWLISFYAMVLSGIVLTVRGLIK